MRSKVFSPINVVYGNEIIEKVLNFSQGLRLDEHTLGFDEIAQQGPGGDFLTSPLTLENFRNAYTVSGIFPQYSMEEWQQVGQPHPRDLLSTYTSDLLASLPEPKDYHELMDKGRDFIQSR